MECGPRNFVMLNGEVLEFVVLAICPLADLSPYALVDSMACRLVDITAARSPAGSRVLFGVLVQFCLPFFVPLHAMSRNH